MLWSEKEEKIEGEWEVATWRRVVLTLLIIYIHIYILLKSYYLIEADIETGPSYSL